MPLRASKADDRGSPPTRLSATTVGSPARGSIIRPGGSQGRGCHAGSAGRHPVHRDGRRGRHRGGRRADHPDRPAERGFRRPVAVQRRTAGASQRQLRAVRGRGGRRAARGEGLHHTHHAGHGDPHPLRDRGRLPQGAGRTVALRPQRRLRTALPADLSGPHRHPALPRSGHRRQFRGRRPRDQGLQPVTVGLWPGLSPHVRGPVPAHARRRAGCDQQCEALRCRVGPRPRPPVAPHRRRPDRQADRHRRSGALRPQRRLLRGRLRSRGHHLRAPAGAGRHDALRHPRVPAPEGDIGRRDRDDHRAGGADHVRQVVGHPSAPAGPSGRLRRGLSRDRLLDPHPDGAGG